MDGGTSVLKDRKEDLEDRSQRGLIAGRLRRFRRAGANDELERDSDDPMLLPELSGFFGSPELIQDTSENAPCQWHFVFPLVGRTPRSRTGS